MSNAALSFLVSSHIPISDDIWASLVGRDELTITEHPNHEHVIGSMTIDIQRSNIRGQSCFYVHQSTVISRKPGFDHICHVTGFVNRNLDVIEERRVIILRNNADDIKESRPLFRGGKLVPKFVEVETCRSIVKSDAENCIHVSEWRRKNGHIDPTHSCPMNVPIDLPSEAALMSDSALILAEKLLAKLEMTGKFAKLMTLDKKAWCAPITLKVAKEDEKLFKVAKSSPVDKGTTTSVYNSENGALESRFIETAQDKVYQLKKSEQSNCHELMELNGDEEEKGNKLIKKRIFEEKFSENLLRFQNKVTDEDLLALLKDAVSQILMEKPKNPLESMKTYFECLKDCIK